MLCLTAAAAVILLSPPAGTMTAQNEYTPEDTASISILCPSNSGLTEIISYYAVQWRGLTECNVIISTYDSDKELSDMLENSRPDLLVCSGELSFYFSEARYLSDTGNEAIVFSPVFSECSDSIGSSFFPIGADCDILAVNSGMCSSITGYDNGSCFDTFESLLQFASVYSKAEHRAFFSADSFAGLFLACMQGLDHNISANKTTDALNASYVEFYNYLAEGFMGGSIAQYETKCSELLMNKLLPAAIIRSSEAAKLGSGFDFYPVPAFSGGVSTCNADIIGFSVTCENPDNISFAASFLSSFFTDPNYCSSVIELGFLPASGYSTGITKYSLSSVFDSINDNYRLVVPEINGDYSMNRDEFESRFRAESKLLSE